MFLKNIQDKLCLATKKSSLPERLFRHAYLWKGTLTKEHECENIAAFEMCDFILRVIKILTIHCRGTKLNRVVSSK